MVAHQLVAERFVSIMPNKKHRNESFSRSFRRDPIARIIAGAIGLMIIGALLALVFALTSGFFVIGDSPQNYDEQKVISTRNYLLIADDRSKAQAWADYIMALELNGQSSEARDELALAQAENLEVERSQAIMFAHAFLLEREGRIDEASALYTELSALLMEAYETELARGGDKNWAIASGVPENFLRAQLSLASFAIKAKDWESALSYLDTYLEIKSTDAGVLIDRGNVKLELGDKQGALKDFERALMFLPDDPEALEGKKQAEE